MKLFHKKLKTYIRFLYFDSLEVFQEKFLINGLFAHVIFNRGLMCKKLYYQICIDIYKQSYLDLEIHNRNCE